MLVDWVASLYQSVQATFVAHGWPLWVLAVLTAVLKVAGVLVWILLNVLFLIWLERKISGHVQNRPGPVYTGRFGLLQTLADALKVLLKEDVIPAGADRWVFVLAPLVAFVPSVMIWVVIPFSRGVQAQDLNIGILYVAALASFTVPSLLMAGWSSDNKWSLMGALRSAAQLISYEVPLILAELGVVVLAGSLRLSDIIAAQQRSVWFLFLQPVGFVVYFIAALAESNRTPFDLPEAESELVAGFNTEYSGFRWSIFFLTEYANLLGMASLAATLFLGGWSGPFLPPFVWFVIKTYFFVFLAMWIRWTLPRIRVDQLMDLGWKFLLPVALVNLVVTGVFVVL
ncbi:MAG: NADH-quinone oxidoreductase subunit NuoH [Limnochordaceae bacterium]|nr:NADH-quinone oxidoreductase subunit NuoH [Limnochordaceae bacterium]